MSLASERAYALTNNTPQGRHAEVAALALDAISPMFSSLEIEGIRDVQALHICVLESCQLSAGVVPFEDGSSLLLIHSGLLNWLFFISQLAMIYRRGHGLKFEAIDRREAKRRHGAVSAFMRSRVILSRLDHRFNPELSIEHRLYGTDILDLLAANFTDAIYFVVAHEAAHHILGHPGAAKLFGEEIPQPAVVHAWERETEADNFAARFMKSWEEIKRTSSLAGFNADISRMQTAEAIETALCAVMTFETGYMARCGATHPPAMLRSFECRKLLDFEMRRSDRRRLSRRRYARFPIARFYTAGYLVTPLSSEEWEAALESPGITEHEKSTLEFSRSLEGVMCGIKGPDRRRLVDEGHVEPRYLSYFGLRKKDQLKDLCAEFGMAALDIDTLFDQRQPLSYAAALRMFASLPLLERVDSELTRRLIAYDMVIHHWIHFEPPWKRET